MSLIKIWNEWVSDKSPLQSGKKVILKEKVEKETHHIIFISRVFQRPISFREFFRDIENLVINFFKAIHAHLPLGKSKTLQANGTSFENHWLKQ